jgi:hypothetical protein
MIEREPGQDFEKNMSESEDEKELKQEFGDAVTRLTNWGITDLTPREAIYLRKYLKETLETYRRDLKDYRDAKIAGARKRSQNLDHWRMRSAGNAAAEEWLYNYLDVDPNDLKELCPTQGVIEHQYDWKTSRGNTPLRVEKNTIREFDRDSGSQSESRDHISELQDRGADYSIYKHCPWDDPKIIKYIQNKRDKLQAESETSGIEE